MIFRIMGRDRGKAPGRTAKRGTRSCFASGWSFVGYSLFFVLLHFISCNAWGNNAMVLQSDGFSNGSMIPSVYTCQGDNTSPPLSWKDAPGNTRSFAVIFDDPDAPGGVWDHWLYYNIPSHTKGLKGGIPAGKELPDGSRQGLNSWGRTEYGGPCPPSGKHRYIFHLYALDTILTFPSPPVKSTLMKAMQGHIIAKAELMGYYKKH